MYYNPSNEFLKFVWRVKKETNSDIAFTWLFAANKHGEQKRKHTGKPYIIHPEFVAKMIYNLTGDVEMTQAGLLHDTLEDTNTFFDELKEHFSEKTANLTLELTMDDNLKQAMGKKKAMLESVNRMSDDAFLLKLCDRFHNILDLEDEGMAIDFVKWYHKETTFVLDGLQRNILPKHEVVINRLKALLEYYEEIFKL